MAAADDALAGVLGEIERARKILGGIKTTQVRKLEHRQFFQAVAMSWFRSRRPALVPMAGADSLEPIDSAFRSILEASERGVTKATYITSLKDAKASLVSLRSALLSGTNSISTTDLAPDFSPLTSDSAMQAILARRWEECHRCIAAEAPLAATVMMGGLLEALLVARANRLRDKAPLFKARAAPLDPKTKKPLDLRHWMLASYIDVAHELGWITKSAKDVAVVLRDYRNYVHPEKERSHGVVLTASDAQMFWELSKMLARQVLDGPSAAVGA